jgi:hypothetical protein
MGRVYGRAAAAGPRGQGKKNPGHQPGWEAFLLSHIKAPAQGGKAGSGKPPGRNLTAPRAIKQQKWLKFPTAHPRPPRQGGWGTIFAMVLHASYPHGRPRRLRRDTFTRNLVREHALSAHDLIYPVFVLDGAGGARRWPRCRASSGSASTCCCRSREQCVALGIPVLALFPVIDPALKTDDGREAWNPEGLVPRVVRALKQRFPELGVMTDVALDPFTSHGQDGLLDPTGYILNDETVEVLTRRRWCRPRPASTSWRPAT